MHGWHKGANRAFAPIGCAHKVEELESSQFLVDNLPAESGGLFENRGHGPNSTRTLVVIIVSCCEMRGRRITF
jgi:hypothetical protein